MNANPRALTEQPNLEGKNFLQNTEFLPNIHLL